MYYRECPYCGDYLDTGEKCDCIDRREQKMRKRLAYNQKAEELLEVGEWTQEELNLCY